jgi:IS1 family transposase
MRIDEAKALQVLKMLLEGVSIRSTVRLTHVAKGTILNLLELVGRRAMTYWQTKMQNLPAANVECDEVWGFIGCKEKTRLTRKYSEEYGDVYTFTGIERTTKLLLAWHAGRRTPTDTVLFSEKLRYATAGRVQLTTDGYAPYKIAMPDAFHGQVDFTQLVKIYGKQADGTAGRYSPAEITNIRKHVVCGHPDEELACTSHIERHNLSIRMAVRRMTRLTNAFSKKRENHEYHLALYFLYYNFCRKHMTLKETPAMAAGLTDHAWTLAELLNQLATHC